jgi:hypothetical protein
MDIAWRNRILDDNVVADGQFCRIRLGSLDFEGAVTIRRDGHMLTIHFLPEDRTMPPVLVWKRIVKTNSIDGAKHLIEVEVASWRADLNR